VPYVNAARAVVTDTSHLVVIFVAVLVVVDLLGAVVWIYLKRFHLSLSLSLSLLAVLGDSDNVKKVKGKGRLICIALHCEKLNSEALRYGSHSCYTATTVDFY